MQTVHVQRDFSAPVDRLYAYLSEHENLAAIFPTRVERLRDGETERNGVGSVRKLSFNGLLPFEETVTEAIPNERIEYRITKGSPLRRHHGTMLFSATGESGSHLDYTINFGAVVPGLDVVIAAGLRRSISQGLDKVAARL